MAYKKLKAEKAREIALAGFDVMTLYRNEFPFNCGLKKDGVIWGDCWCMYPKVLIWSWACGINPFLNRKAGTYFHNGQNGSYDGIGASGLGDWDGDTIMSTCTDVRSDFSKMEVAELLLIKGQHMAMYIGDYTLSMKPHKGKTFNSVEFNRFDNENDGQIPFWTAADGQRYWWKGGPAMGGKFDLVGKLSKWISYTKPKPQPEKIDVDGEWGYQTSLLAQKIYGTEQDGIVSHQYKSTKPYCPNCVPAKENSGSWEFDSTKGYSPLIAAIQKDCGLKIAKTSKEYGKMKVMTRKALQKKLGVKEDGDIGPKTVKAFQKYLNAQAKKKK